MKRSPRRKHQERRAACVEKAKEDARKEAKLDAARKANKKRQYRIDGKIAAARERKRLGGEHRSFDGAECKKS